MSTTEIVRAAFRHYREQNVEAAQQLYADDFRFTSPQDDHIDRATYFERCFPTAGRLRRQDLLQVIAAGDDLVIAYYEYELVDGAKATAKKVDKITPAVSVAKGQRWKHNTTKAVIKLGVPVSEKTVRYVNNAGINLQMRVKTLNDNYTLVG